MVGDKPYSQTCLQHWTYHICSKTDVGSTLHFSEIRPANTDPDDICTGITLRMNVYGFWMLMTKCVRGFAALWRSRTDKVVSRGLLLSKRRKEPYN